MNDCTILLVEDSPADVDLIREYLAEDNRSEYDIIEAETLAAAQKFLGRKNIDVVLLDLSLPDSNGLDTVRTLLGNYPQMVIIVLTGIKDQQLALQSVRFGAQDYIEKDQLTPQLLHRSISYAIERKKAAMEKMVLFTDLGNALDQLEALQGLLPVCLSCKNVRDEKGNWQSIDAYIKNFSSKESNRVICPDCRQETFSDYKKE